MLTMIFFAAQVLVAAVVLFREKGDDERFADKLGYRS
jgi:hypothetical protein